MIFWFIIRTIKYFFTIDANIERYLWYSYYLPMLFIPQAALQAAILLGQPEEYTKADSFWYKDISPEKLIDVIEKTMAGEHIFPDKTPSVKLGLADSSELTAKEIEVLRLVCEGLEYSEIAERMHISQRTVKFHISNILSKTGYANKTRLAIAVTNKNFIIPSSPEKNPSSW